MSEISLAVIFKRRVKWDCSNSYFIVKLCRGIFLCYYTEHKRSTMAGILKGDMGEWKRKVIVFCSQYSVSLSKRLRCVRCERNRCLKAFDGNTECCWWFCLVSSKGYVRPKYVTVQYIRVVVFILLHHVHGIEERIMNLWMKSYREEFCLWCYNLGQDRRKIKTPSPPPPKSTDATGKRGVLAFARLHHRSGEMELHII